MLVVATGIYSEPYVANFRGQEKFIGSITHPCSIKKSEQLADKRVVVIGGGKSATDMAVLGGTFARTCHLIFRRAHWMIPTRRAKSPHLAVETIFKERNHCKHWPKRMSGVFLSSMFC